MLTFLYSTETRRTRDQSVYRAHQYITQEPTVYKQDGIKRSRFMAPQFDSGKGLRQVNVHAREPFKIITFFRAYMPSI